MRFTSKSRVATFVAAAAVVGGVAAGPANAFSIPKQVESYAANTHRASMGGAVTFDQDFGSEQIKGNVSGGVSYNAPIADFTAGCARAKIQWRNADADVLRTKFSGEACSSNGAIPAGATYSKTFTSSSTRSVRIKLQVKQFGQDGYSTVATRTIRVG